MIKIRLATKEDFEFIYDIWVEGISNSYDELSIDTETKIDFYNCFVSRDTIFNYWVAINLENKIVGWQSLSRITQNPIGKNLYAEISTYISKNYRSQGIGSQLKKHVITEAKNSEIEYLICYVAQTNKPARKINENYGFTEVGFMPPSRKNKTLTTVIFVLAI